MINRSKNKRLLLIYWHIPKEHMMIANQIKAIREKSTFTIDTYNTFNQILDKKGYFFNSKSKQTDQIDISAYDGFIIHNTIAYDVNNVRLLDENFSPNLSAFKGVKVLMKQDEHFKTYLTFDLLNDWGFHLLLSCVPPEEWRKHFADRISPSLDILHTLTGYVEEPMKHFTYTQNDHRPVDIFYRGFKLPYSFGRLSYEKYMIGERFKEICKEHNLAWDISSDVKDRIYGKSWIQALARSKGVLAVESGASVFDVDGSIKQKTEEYLKEYPDATFEEIANMFFKDKEYIVQYAQISPRHFEAAATRTLQIMFEGRYSDIFIEDQHYLSLKKDFSNLETILSNFMNPEIRYEITERAYKDIILNEEFSYDSFVKKFDNALKNLMP